MSAAVEQLSAQRERSRANSDDRREVVVDVLEFSRTRAPTTHTHRLNRSRRVRLQGFSLERRKSAFLGESWHFRVRVSYLRVRVSYLRVRVVKFRVRVSERRKNENEKRKRGFSSIYRV